MASKAKETYTITAVTTPIWVAVGVLVSIIAIWSRAVNKDVPEPYLDEVFHIGQAQTYLDGKLFEWDPKITTPPGLYALSLGLFKTTNWGSIPALRALNAFLLPTLVFMIQSVDNHHAESNASEGKPLKQLHTAFNICLFPPMFFFAALYYTDIASTVSVILCWTYFTRIHSKGDPTILQDIVTIALGLLSLTFRQTNIFWVSIFPAGILLVSKIGPFVRENTEDGRLSDAPIQDSKLEDYGYFMVSLGQAIFQSVVMTFKGHGGLVRLIRMLVPYAVIMLCFLGFIVWNGGVVLGDKSNHVATLHLAQVLYLWPYITFFSIPLTYPYLVQGALSLLALLPSVFGSRLPFVSGRKNIMPRLSVAFVFLAIASLIVRYNTIVHPFTLADNRHYTFYLFRLLLRHPAIKFLVAPVYVVGAWSVIQTLGSPAGPLGLRGGRAEIKTKARRSTLSSPLILNHASAGEGCNISFVVVWLMTLTLQLATAPLVEPRYFIVPWVMWRLRVPTAGLTPRADERHNEPKDIWACMKQVLWTKHDHRLWLETAWFLLINAGTGYMFLYKGFVWSQEPDKVQRFMW